MSTHALDIAKIREEYNSADRNRWQGHEATASRMNKAAAHIPALCDEIARLRREVADLYAEQEKT